MTSSDQLYYLRRARQERDRASRSEDNGIANIHLTLADAYDERARTMHARAATPQPELPARADRHSGDDEPKTVGSRDPARSVLQMSAPVREHSKRPKPPLADRQR